MALVHLDLRRRALLEGKAFGDVGPYEELLGQAEFAVDPLNPLNSVILDIELAPRDRAGRVHFTSDVRILRPANPSASQGQRGAFLDVVNRGRSIFMRMLEPGPMGPRTDITEGFLLRRGFTVVTCGWQHDVERGADLFGVLAPIASTIDAPVTGIGLLALRDVVAHLKRDGLEFAIALGASQSGRLLRQFVYLGLCEAEDGGQLAVDGVLAVAAGPRMTEANLRFGEPSSNGPKSALFPFTDAELLGRSVRRGAVPKLIHLNTSSEYCRSSALVHLSAALAHISAETTGNVRDVTLPTNVRNYLCASTQHAPADPDDPPDPRGANPPNTVDYKPFVRAAVDNLSSWVSRGEEPPPSAYPRFADGTLTDDLRPSVDTDGNEVPGLRHPDVSVPLATYTGWNPAREGGGGELVRALGSTMPFSRETIAQRYSSRDTYLDQIRAAARALVAERYLLDQDVEPIVQASARRWDSIACQADTPRVGSSIAAIEDPIRRR